MVALTLTRPWSLVVALGLKDIENRTWEPPATLLKPSDWFAIHAGKGWDEHCISFCTSRGVSIDVFNQRAISVMGAIIAVARYGGCSKSSESRWWMGAPQLVWKIDEVVAIEPVHCRGYQKLWHVPADRLGELMVEFRSARTRGGLPSLG